MRPGSGTIITMSTRSGGRARTIDPALQHMLGSREHPEVAFLDELNCSAQFEITCDSSREAAASKEIGSYCERSALLTLAAMLWPALLCPASLTPSALRSPR